MIVAHKSALPTVEQGGLVAHAGTVSSARTLPGLSGFRYCLHNISFDQFTFVKMHLLAVLGSGTKANFAL